MGQDAFDAVIGHEQIKKQLCRAIASGRLSHALIFAGPEGLGKTRLARAAASVLIGRPVLHDLEQLSCDTDTPFFQDQDDVYYLDRIGSMLRVDQFRRLQEKLMLRTGRNRVSIINHVETMNKEFANRMLKTLEEPPQGVHFILITNQPDLLLPTILSRCVLIPFEPVPDEEMLAGLCRLKGGTPDQYRQAVLWGGGNVARVLSLLEGEGLNAAKQALTFLEIMTNHACPYAKWQSTAAAWGDEDSQAVLRWLAVLIRDMTVLRAGVPKERLRLGFYADTLNELLPHWPDACLFSLLGALDEASEAIVRHVNVRLVWDYVCIRFIEAKGGIES